MKSRPAWSGRAIIDVIVELTQPVSVPDIATALDISDAWAAEVLEMYREAGFAKLETDGRWTIRKRAAQ
jgi:DNA-binding IclR family transcriptional regulator